MPRDNLYQKLHGLPKFTNEEIKAKEDSYAEHVDYREFLPNYLLTSPKKSVFSHTTKSKMMQLKGYKKKQNNSICISPSTLSRTNNENLNFKTFNT